MPRIAILLALALAVPIPAATPAQSPGADSAAEAQALLTKTRQLYHGLRSYRFEHQVLIEARGPKDKAATELGRVDLLTVCDAAEEGDRPGLPTSLDRCRVEASGGGNAVQLICGDRGSWLYSPVEKTYLKGKGVMDIMGSVAVSMLLAVHVWPFEVLSEAGIREARVSRREKFSLGKTQRNCVVVEGTLKPAAAIDFNAAAPPSRDTIGVHSYLSWLSGHGLLKKEADGHYAPGPTVAEKRKAGEPARFELWLDAETSAVLRTRIVAKVYKTGQSGEEEGPILVTLTDTFWVAELNPKLGDEVFRFSPPKDAKEARNGQSKR